jgi:hypothetical protein
MKNETKSPLPIYTGYGAFWTTKFCIDLVRDSSSGFMHRVVRYVSRRREMVRFFGFLVIVNGQRRWPLVVAVTLFNQSNYQKNL